MEEDNIYTYYLIIKKYIIFIALNIILFTGITTYSVFFLIDPVYESEASILIPQKENNINSFLNNIGVNLPEIPSNMLSSFGKSSNNTADFVSILKSRYMAEKVISVLHLENNTELKNKSTKGFQGIIENFQKKVKVFSPSAKDSALRVKARFKDPVLAKKIVTQHFVELQKFLEENNYLTASSNRKFVEKQLHRINTELKNSESNLLDFKKMNQTVSLPEEISEYIKSIAQLEAEEVKSQLEVTEVSERLKYASEKISNFNDEWKNVLKDMEISEAGLKTRKKILEEAKNKYFVLLNSLPSKALILARLEREVKVKNALYILFTQQFEFAKLEELKELQPFKILDKAYVSSKPVFPKKELTIAVAFLISILFTLIFAFFIEYWKALKKSHQTLEI